MMAKSNSTKSLKGKTTRRAAKPAKKPADAVSVLLAAQRKLLASLDGAEGREQRCKKDGRKSDADTYNRMRTALWDRLSVNCDDLSFLTPKTKDGAVFALVVACATLSDIDTVQDADFRYRRKRRGIRLLYGLLRYLVGPDGLTGCNPGDWPGDNLNRVVRNYMPPWKNPHRDLLYGRELLPLPEEAVS
jgi:hypothetical protein